MPCAIACATGLIGQSMSWEQRASMPFLDEVRGISASSRPFATLCGLWKLEYGFVVRQSPGAVASQASGISVMAVSKYALNGSVRTGSTGGTGSWALSVPQPESQGGCPGGSLSPVEPRRAAENTTCSPIDGVGCFTFIVLNYFLVFLALDFDSVLH
ncbi:hypothetical protein B0J13DRAFT_30752 [Dactylonectria estremocensis]|uniref:Uncharacterized protein n=1 Tax=Dactylonectria estremocensis TaxID=1079267 RepID=A0A9P9JE59_9HYPO|nr:hypothetical protein B0J13DRAFT_30752 [Dactylonectria estremocensis]